MTIETIARKDVLTTTPDTAVSAVAATMAEEEVGSLVVVDESNVPVGIITDRDLVVDVFGVGKSATELTARDVMTEKPFTVETGTGVFETISSMCEMGVRRIPVVEDGELAGIVTLDDFVVLLASELSDLAGVIVSESPPYETEAPTP